MRSTAGRFALALVLLSSSIGRTETPAKEAASASGGFRYKPERPIPDTRLVLSDLLVVRYNPLGLENQIRFGYQFKLYNSEKALFRDNFLFFGIYPKVNPAFIKIGPMLEVQPLSILNLRVQLEFIDFFSSFGYLQSFGSPLDNYSQSALKCNEEGAFGGGGEATEACQQVPPGGPASQTFGAPANKNYSTDGAHFVFEPTVQFKAGPIALRNRFALEYWNMRVHPGDTVFYEATLDTLVPSNGWIVANDLDLLFITKYRLVVGVRYSVVKPLYSANDYRPGELDAAQNANPNGHQRIGPLLAYTFREVPYSGFNRPSLILIANWYVSHRWRTGEDVNQGIPYIVLAFAFQSDLL